MTILFLDLETYSDVPITHGTHAYAERAEVLLAAVALDDNPVVVIEADLDYLQELVDEADSVVIHNSAFDRTILAHQNVRIPIERISDTMVRALAHGLPGSLGQLCDILGVPVDKAKDKRGKKLIQLFTKPRPKNMKLRRATKDTHPEEWAEFVEYARLDVEAMREIHKRLPIWNSTPVERKLWAQDQHINDRGIAVDLDLARAALRAAARAGADLADRAKVATGGAVGSLTQRDKLLTYLSEAHDYAPQDMTKGTVTAALKGDLDPAVRELLEIRQQASATSPAKYKVLVNATSPDGRLRGTLQFCGAARTGRWGGRLFQPQNLPRPTLKQAAIDAGIAAMKADCEDLVVNNVMELCASAVRGCLIAPAGRKLVVADLSNIEGRVLAWLAGEDWKTKAFTDFDRGVGHDLYVLAYSRSFSVTPQQVLDNKKNGDGMMRQLGKIMELALGYQGSVGAFQSMARLYGIEKEEDEVLSIVKAWRKAHPRIVSFWYDIEYAARQVLREPDAKRKVRDLMLDVEDGWLRIRLPSGRYLCYPDARENDEDKITYSGVNQYTRKWETLETYGGKLCIAKGTPVLTDKGWLPIEQVSLAHKVWDGLNWVPHEGLARNGVMEVIQAHGVWMTPDHEVLTEKGWTRASQSEGHKRAACRLPHGVELRGQRRKKISVAGALRLWKNRKNASVRAYETEEAKHNVFLRLPARQHHSEKANDAWDVQASGVCRVALYDRPLLSAYASGLEELWRAWDNCVRSLAGFVWGVLARHGANISPRPDAGAQKQQRVIQPEELRVGLVQETSQQHAREPEGKDALGFDERSSTVGSNRDRCDDASVPFKQRRFRKSSYIPARQYAEVFDLVNCGPLRRFVVADKDGEPLIVHNCENIVQATARDVLAHGMLLADAAGYDVCLHVHDELITETPDDPAYSAEGLSALMAKGPGWSLGLPLAAAGFETQRYRKD